MQNGPGEGFEATSPSGTVYEFDYWAPKGGGSLGAFASTDEGCGHPFCPPSGATPAFANHTNIYATQVTDKNGNWVKYDYNSSGNLTKIHASDGREITVQYASGRISSVTANGRVWTYSYVNQNGLYNLDKVTQPDTKFWDYDVEPQKPQQRGVSCGAAVFTGTMTVKHPYGTEGQFDYTLTKNGKNNATTLQQSWSGTIVHPDGSSTTITAGCNGYDMQSFAWTKAITKKTLTLPSSTNYVWNYWYEQDSGHRNAPSGSSSLDLKKRIITDPEGHETHLWYNRRHLAANEGKLMKSEVHDGATVMNLDTHTYLEAPSLGDSTVRFKHAPSRTSERLQTKTITTRDGDTFTSENSFNTNLSSSTYSFGYPLTAKTYSNVSTTPRETVTVYAHNKTKWVLGLPSSETTNGRQMATYTYDSFGRKTAQTRYGQPQATYSYHTNAAYKGALHWFEDALSRRTYALDWKRGTAQRIKRPDNLSEYQYVDNNGWVTQTKDAKGKSAYYSHDTMGRTTLINPPGSWANTSISYSFGTNTVQTITKGQSRSTITYDGLFRTVLEKTEDLSSSWVSYVNTAYDSSGSATFTSQPSSNQFETKGTDFIYDALGRSKTKTQTMSPYAATTTSYHSSHRMRVTDPSGAHMDYYGYGYDGPNSSDYRAMYHSSGKKTYMYKNVWGEMSRLRQWGTMNGYTEDKSQYFYYDSQNRLCRHYVPEAGATKYQYDAAGQMTAYVKGQSNSGCTVPSSNSRVSAAYDNLGRITSTNFTDPNTPDITRTYDANGNVLTNHRGGVNWTYAYNDINLPTYETLTLDSKTFGIGYLYNTSGHLTRRTLPGGAIINYTPDGLGRAKTIKHGTANLATSINYHASGSVSGLTYGNGHLFTQTLNARLQPERMMSYKGGIKALDLTYSYDSRGLVTGITDQEVSGQNKSFGYDALSQLTSATGPWGSGSFTYDTLGNVRQKVLGARTIAMSYNSANRLSSYTDSAGPNKTLGYDARGNVTTLGTLAFTYDMADQPRAVTGGTYAYDGNMKRARAYVNAGTIYNVYDSAGSLVHVDDVTANKTTDYVSGPNGSLARITNGVVTYLHNDHLGTSVTGTTPSGAVAWREDTTPFGITANNPAANDNLAGFTGHIRDSATGLNYMQARYYDPVIGRFLSVDPVTFMDTGNPDYFNRYMYTANNPVNMVDSNGEFFQPASFAWNYGTSSQTKANVHTTLDVGGLVPAIGIIADLANTGLYAAEGDIINTGISAAAMIPAAGQGVTAAKLGAKYGDDAAGLIYKRTNANTGRCYIGRCNSDKLFERRQRDHARKNPDADYEYEIVERAELGQPLRHAEQKHITKEGGPTNKSNPNGGTENKRNEIRQPSTGTRYRRRK